MRHIGKHIMEVLEAQGHSARWLGEQLPCERSNVYNIFKRSSIGTDLLFRLSEVLGHDFFKDLSEELDLDGRGGLPEARPEE